ncbi:hypothetical protein SUGI_0729080 [Cryptomeria japonica]|uniref:uncharacterized protein LOC131040012 n=1 Tax=Cryptomeria japonica TaxID=3369 RepID=UPI0024149CAF|nr:uncharacterized protein LOC131040012 [Cryptomeria japonica]GLJ36320.1 hypothetical protein SUGI_0729080 [Cryptomeria japonica]
MGGQVSKQKSVLQQKRALKDLNGTEGVDFPGSDYTTADGNRKEWMSKLNLNTVRIKDVVWPGTHDSATDKMGIPLVSRPLARCQKCSIYNQLVGGTRVLDIRVEASRRVCHGILKSYKVDLVIRDIKRFLSETQSEFLIVEIRTEYGHQDPPEMEKWLMDQLGDYLIHQDNHVFDKTLAELLPKRVICVWKPAAKGAAPHPGSALWSSAYLKDDWIDTDLPSTKFESNLSKLGSHPPVSSRKYFYRVENTATPQANNPVVCVKPVTNRIRGYARLFISQAFKKGYGDRLQIFSCDFIDDDFVDACIGITRARMEGKA